MKKQQNKESISPFSAEIMQQMLFRYELLQKALTDLPWVLQGTVVETPPKSLTARATYSWTRKVRAKTITVSLSPEQAIAFRSAIAANRRVEKALLEMREVSQDVLMNSLPRTRKRLASRAKTQGQESS
jgi:hypothetical protein